MQVTLTAKLSLESNPGLVLLPLVYPSSKVTVPRRDYESSGAFVSVFIQKVWDMPRNLQVLAVFQKATLRNSGSLLQRALLPVSGSERKNVIGHFSQVPGPGTKTASSKSYLGIGSPPTETGIPSPLPRERAGRGGVATGTGTPRRNLFLPGPPLSEAWTPSQGQVVPSSSATLTSRQI